MKKKLFMTTVLISVLPFLLSARLKQRSKPPKLWAATSVSQPLFQQGWTKDLLIHFTLVNDGNEVIDAEKLISSSKIVINGKELEDSAFIFGNGPRSLHWKALASGETVHLTIALEKYFQRPGIYEVVWRGEGFETLPVVLRVMQSKPSGT